MDERATAERGRGIDRVLFITVTLLAACGIVMVYSASAVTAARQLGNPSYFLVRQTIYAGVGLAVMLVASRIDTRVWARLIYPSLALSLLGVVISLTRLGMTLNGASRWISLGPITVQPAEALKLSLVLWLSYSLAKKSDKIKTFSIGFLPHLLVPGIAIILCLLQPDFGTAVVLALLTFSLLFVAGAKLGYIMGAALLAAPVAYLLVTGSEYRLKRLLTFLDPLSTRFGDGYQLSQSLFGFGAGGVTGVGLGDGMQKFLFLPEAHNDFIAAIIAEELGMVGVLAVMLLIGIVVQRGVAIAFRARDEFGTYVALGISVLIGLQTLANLGVAMGLLPTKGLNLPFISFGGSALVMTLLAVGILLGISRQSGAEAVANEVAEGADGGTGVNRRRQPSEEGAGG
ncbi:MAG TPA: putative lipid II flippase FtsW [Polyangia bacterium]|nr:putative lipid II flippase FtsW [Polyangia bacterium]